MAGLPRRDQDVVRITTAGTSRADDLRRRQRNYLVSMSLRTICFIGALIFRDTWAVWFLIAGAVFLPYVAVVLANAVTTRPEVGGLRQGLSDRPELATSEGTRQL